MYFLNGYWYFVHFIRLQRLNGDSTGACLLQKSNCSHGLKLGTCRPTGGGGMRVPIILFSFL